MVFPHKKRKNSRISVTVQSKETFQNFFKGHSKLILIEQTKIFLALKEQSCEKDLLIL